ncbi:MAG: glycosyltransferase [Candidatus Bathyarchaeota archaeon]|nr:MAG: glycosyltransferase [Candidatus Bathyarchaeota archaeon]
MDSPFLGECFSKASGALLERRNTPTFEREACPLIVEVTAAIGVILSSFYLGYFLLMSMKARGNKHLHGVSQKDYTPFVSVVVPTYNEEDTILSKLEDLEKQDYPDMEIFVIDGASSDGTVRLAKKFSEESDLKVRLIEEKERGGKASSLNKAFQLCTGEVVVMTDADAIWEKDTLRKAVSNFSDQKIGAVTGRQVLLNPDQNLATRVEKTYRNFYEVLRVGESVLDSTPIFHGEISCFRKSLIENLDECSMADDSELAVKIRKKGFRSIYDPNVVFYEHAPPTFKSRLVQKLRRGQGLIQMFLRERGILFNQKFENFGVLVFPAEFFMHVISPALVLAFLVSFFFALLSIDWYLLIGLAFGGVVLFAVLTVAKGFVANLPLSFLNSQLILLVSLVYQMLGRSQHKWAKVDEIRKLWKNDAHRAKCDSREDP